jgi:hypothetical protein
MESSSVGACERPHRLKKSSATGISQYCAMNICSQSFQGVVVLLFDAIEVLVAQASACVFLIFMGAEHHTG